MARRRSADDDPYDLTAPDPREEPATVAVLRAEIAALRTELAGVSRLVEQQTLATQRAEEAARDASDTRERLARAEEQLGALRNERREQGPDGDVAGRLSAFEATLQTLAGQVTTAAASARESLQLVQSQARGVEAAGELARSVEALSRRLDQTQAGLQQQIAPADTAAPDRSADLIAQLQDVRERAQSAEQRAIAAERLAEQGVMRAQSAEETSRGVDVVLRAVDEIRAGQQAEGERRAAAEKAQAERWERFVAGVTERAARSEGIALAAQSEAQAAANAAAKAAEDVAVVAATTQSTATDTLIAALRGGLSDLATFLKSDQVLGTAFSFKGLQVPDAAIVGVDAAKLASGDIDDARMVANLIAAFNATAGGADASKVTTGDLPTAQMQTNAGAAVNAGATNINGSKVAGALASSVTIGGDKITGDLTLAGGQKVGFFGATAVVQQTRGATLTNNVTSSGTTDQIDDLTLVDYATDKTILQGDLYQLARVQRQHDVALRALGLLT